MSRRLVPHTPALNMESEEPVQQISERYLADLRAKGKHLPSTLHTYTCAVRRFARAFGPTAVIADATPEACQAYFTQHERAHNPNTTLLQAAAVHGFLLWCVKKGYLLEDPMEAIELPEHRKPAQEWLRDEEVQALLEACERIADDTRRIQAKAVFAVLVFAGLRRCEVLRLSVDDIFLKDWRIEIRRGKGDKPRTVYVPPECLRALRDWLRVRPETKEHRRLFTANARFWLGVRGMMTLVKEVYAIAGVKRPYKPNHVLRSAYTTRIIANGVDPVRAQSQLGHEKLETTLGYVRNQAIEMKSAAMFAQFQPPAGDGLPPSVSHQMQQQMKKRRRIGL